MGGYGSIYIRLDTSSLMVKVDLYNYENRWKNWKENHRTEDIEDISKNNSDIIKQYLFDMEEGKNISTKNKKGARSYSRLNVLRDRLIFLTKTFETRFNFIDLVNLNSNNIHEVFEGMRKGEIKKRNGEPFKSSADYVKCFKAFYHWYMKINRRKAKPKIIVDITEDLDASYDIKPVWVYLNEKQADKMIQKANSYYQPLLSFAYCSGARPTEIFSILVQEITTNNNGEVFVNLKEENSKTFGRKIKLKLCGEQILKFIKDNKLKPEDKLFNHSLPMTNKYIQELAKKLFGDKISEGGEKFSSMSLYDWRHLSCCFWLERYKRNSDLMYRFGWKTEKYIHYYSEFKGKRDKISDDDMYIDITKTALEKEVGKLKKHSKAQDQTLNELMGLLEGLDKEKIDQLKESPIVKYKLFQK